MRDDSPYWQRRCRYAWRAMWRDLGGATPWVASVLTGFVGAGVAVWLDASQAWDGAIRAAGVGFVSAVATMLGFLLRAYMLAPSRMDAEKEAELRAERERREAAQAMLDEVNKIALEKKEIVRDLAVTIRLGRQIQSLLKDGQLEDASELWPTIEDWRKGVAATLLRHGLRHEIDHVMHLVEFDAHRREALRLDEASVGTLRAIAAAALGDSINELRRIQERYDVRFSLDEAF